MNSHRTQLSMAVTSGLLGLLSGVLSSSTILLRFPGTSQSPVMWLPGFVFALVVLLPISRWTGDGWQRTVGAIVASSAIYPFAHQFAAESAIGHSSAFIVAAVAFSGLVGSSVLAATFLFGRPFFARSATVTVILGTAIGALSGAYLLIPTSHPSLGLRLGVILVVWQSVVGASLGRGALGLPNQTLQPTAAQRPV